MTGSGDSKVVPLPPQRATKVHVMASETGGLPPEITFVVHELEGGRVQHHQVLQGGEPVSWRDLFESLTQDDYARLSISAVIVEAPFDEVYFETPPLMAETFDSSAEFVLVDASLRSEPDPSAFSEHLSAPNSGEVLTRTFTNLRGDATLVVPTDLADEARRNYLRSFLRTAPERQIHSFWSETAFAAQRRINDVPVWISTSGGGVPWLHLRLDDRPKYYNYQPYRERPAGS